MSLEAAKTIKIPDAVFERPTLTDWSAKERQADLAWIDENLPTFKNVALAEYDQQGPGIILIHIFEKQDDVGHPYGYLSQSVVEEIGDEEVKQAVQAYDPHNEVVVTLLKSNYRGRTYQVQF